jgi:hypothetical protein
MPRKVPHQLRTGLPGVRSGDTRRTLRISTCPGPPPVCASVHTFLLVDGLDMISRSDSRVVGLHPKQLLRPGGPLYPTDVARTVSVASQRGREPDHDGLHIRLRLRGEAVVWTDLMYPGHRYEPIEEARFHLGQYTAEVQRAYAAWASLSKE